MIKCARVTAAPSGVFSVTFDTAIPLLASATASLGIATTYPNTQVRVTCAPIPANVFVLTVSLFESLIETKAHRLFLEKAPIFAIPFVTFLYSKADL